jgi:hypothetical protein
MKEIMNRRSKKERCWNSLHKALKLMRIFLRPLSPKVLRFKMLKNIIK